MKKYLLCLTLAFGLAACENTELPNPTQGLSDAEIVAGLKEALKVGTDTAVNLTSKVNGYFGNAAIKILLPEEAEKVVKTLRDMGMGKLVDDAILSLNRAAEDAATEAKPIFVDAITGMTIQDGKNILFGDSTAATTFLHNRTFNNLFQAFQPKIKASLEKVGATAHWNTVFTTYNAIPLVEKVNPDLDDYTTNKALDGLFHMVSLEERNIRKDPVARVSDILEKVFGELDK